MVQEPGYLTEVVLANPTLKALSSHSLPLPLIDIPGIEFELLFMLRHPLLRVRSVYDFEHKQEAHTPGARFAKNATFNEYVEWRMREDVNPTIRNMQVRYLTRRYDLHKHTEIGDRHLEYAMKSVDQTPLCGLVELFDESLAIFDSHLSARGKRLNWEYVKQNVTDHSSDTEKEKLIKLNSDLGNELYQQLIEQNQVDMNLYEYAKQQITARHSKILNGMQTNVSANG